MGICQPQAGKTLFREQGQNMARVPLVGLLLANVTGPNLCCIPDPQLVPKLLQQQLKPQCIACGFHANQRRPFKFTIELLRLPVGMHQLLLLHLPGLRVQYCNLLVARVKITAYNLHKAPLLPRDPLRSPNNQSLAPGPLGPFGLCNQPERSVVEGSVVYCRRSLPPLSSRPERSAVEGPAVFTFGSD